MAERLKEPMKSWDYYRQRDRNAAEGILLVRDMQEKQCHSWGLYVSCEQEVQTLLFSYSVSGAGYELTKGNSFFLLKWEEKVKCLLTIFMISHRFHKQEIRRLGSSRDEEAERYRNSWHLKWKCEKKILVWTASFKNASGLTLFLSDATHLLGFMYPNSPRHLCVTINSTQYTKA